MALAEVLREAVVGDAVQGVKPGHELMYTPAIRSLDTFPMVFTAS